MSWPVVSLGSVATLARDGIAPENISSGTLFVGLENIKKGGDFEGVAPVDRGEIASTKFSFTPKHVLYGKLRPYLAKIALPEIEGVCSTDIIPILPGSGLDRRYLAHYLLTPQMVALASDRATGANLPRLSPRVLLEFPIPLPPLDEQRRIAAMIDQAEALRAKRRAAIALLEQLPQAIFLEMFGDPATNPKGWPMVSLEGVSQFIRNGKSIKQDKEAGGLPITRIETIANGHVNIAKCGYAGISEEDASGFLMEEGDLLFSHINSFEHVGKTAIYEGVPTLLVHGMNLLCIRPNQQVVRPLYILHHLRTSAFRRDLEPFINKAVNQASVSGTNLKAVKVPLPPIETQQLFAHRVEAIYHTRVAHQSALAKLDALFASLQHAAFGGQV